MCRIDIRAVPESYILMDSWFFSDFLVRKLKQLGLQSVCLVKSNLQFKLGKGSSKSFSQKELLKKINGDKLNKAKIITPVIANIRLQIFEFNRRHDNDSRSIGELFYSACSELTAITFAEGLQTLLLLIDNIAVTLDAATVSVKVNLLKLKEVISNAISKWFSSMTTTSKCTFSYHKRLIIKNLT